MDISRNYSLRDSLAERAVPDLQQQLSRVQEQTATGRRINRPSDDPNAAARVSALKALESKHAQYEGNIEHARNWLDQGQHELDKLSGILRNARQMASEARNPNFNDDDLEQMAGTVQDMIGDVVNILNTKHNSTGEYLFAGTDTTTTPPPIEITNVANNTIAYNGNADRPERRLGQNTTVPVSVNGETIVDVDESGVGAGTNLIDRLDDFKTALENSDQAQLQTSIGDLKEAHDHVVDLTSELGTYGNRVQVAFDHLQDTSLTNEQRRSELEDTDFPKAFSALQRLQTNYQASLKVTSTILNRTSLVDYL